MGGVCKILLMNQNGVDIKEPTKIGLKICFRSQIILCFQKLKFVTSMTTQFYAKESNIGQRPDSGHILTIRVPAHTEFKINLNSNR